MASWTSRLLARLRKRDAIRYQVLAHLFVAGIHNLIKSSYDDYHAPANICGPESVANQRPDRIDGLCWRARRSSSSSSCGSTEIQQVVSSRKQEQAIINGFSGQTNTMRQRRSARWAPTVDGHGPRSSSPPSRLRAYKQNGARERPSDNNPEGQDGWDWAGFPKFWLPFRLYQTASDIWMTWTIIRTLFMRQLEDLISPATQHFFGMPGNCFLPGRMVVPLVISPLLAALLASFYLSWRVWQRLTKHDRLISMVVFLLASERDRDRFYAILEARQSQSSRVCSLLGPAWTSGTTLGGINPITYTGIYGIPTSSKITEQLFLETTCYQVHQSNRAPLFRLRLNRTPEAWAKLVHHVALTNLIVVSAFGVMFMLAASYNAVAVFSEYRYAHVYRGCYPPLEELRARNQLDYFPSFKLVNWHHALSALVFDPIENAFLWGNSGMFITFAPAFSYLLNYDLLLHWSGLEVKLERLLERVKHQFLIRGEHERQQVARFYNNLPPPLYSLADDEDLDELFKLGSMTGEEHRTLEIDIHEIQFEICDFFHQMKRVNGVVGDTLTLTLIVWLTGFSFVIYNQLSYNSDSIVLIVGMILGLGVFVITLASFYLLELRRRCLKSHRVLCSLMAYDQSRHKNAFAKLLEFYTTNRTNYHILRTYPYKPTTFITIVGWSFSCLFIAYTLFGQQNN